MGIRTDTGGALASAYRAFADTLHGSGCPLRNGPSRFRNLVPRATGIRYTIPYRVFQRHQAHRSAGGKRRISFRVKRVVHAWTPPGELQFMRVAMVIRAHPWRARRGPFAGMSRWPAWRRPLACACVTELHSRHTRTIGTVYRAAARRAAARETLETIDAAAHAAR